MKDTSLFDTPVLFILFNRPDHARQVLNRIRYIQPTHLYIAIDGPRIDNPQDLINVQKCIDLINEIDWDCKVSKLIRQQNLGCKIGVSSAISWFFNHVNAGIILEDDCLPDLTFFDLCRTLLKKYEDNPKVMHIGGTNLFEKVKWGSDTYFFSLIPHIWGWATWRRAWALYDVNMTDYIKFVNQKGIARSVISRRSRSYWKFSFDNTYSGIINTWDYQWVFAIWKNQGLCIIPNQNLVSNIGFGKEATHTHENSVFANLPTVPIDKDNIIHPKVVVINKQATEYAFAKFYRLPSLWEARINRIKKMLNVFRFLM